MDGKAGMSKKEKRKKCNKAVQEFRERQKEEKRKRANESIKRCRANKNEKKEADEK